MSMFRRTLPSLDPLVFFEAAARHRSYSGAARELNVSQVAVSKRIRGLEADIGKPLFERQGRSVALTPTGHAFAERIRAGLGFIEEAVLAARADMPRQRQVIQIAANENVNFFWLAPRVRQFQMTGNDAVISVLTANNVSDVVQTDTDIAVFYGNAPPEGWDAHTLFSEIIAPVSSPDYRSRFESGLLQQVTLLDYHKEAPEWVNWDSLPAPGTRGWFTRTAKRLCSSYIQSVSLAMEGEGVALGVLPMLHREIADGRLTQTAAPPIHTGHRYFLSTPRARKRSAVTDELISYLMRK